jgi:hypothetical protein
VRRCADGARVEPQKARAQHPVASGRSPRHSRRIGGVHGRLRYIGTLTPQKGATVAPANTASRPPHTARVRRHVTIRRNLAMLLREDERGVLAIGQLSHAWVSGQLARVWGNEQFGRLEPREEVCLAAEQHAGWATWDLEPALNPDTGWPRSFMEMPLATHLQIWREGPESLVSQSRYAALLASIRGTRLFRRRALEQETPDDARAIRSFLSQQEDLQRRLIDTLRADPATAAAATDERLARNSQLVWNLDYLSLALCLGWAPATARDVPTARDPVDVTVLASSENGAISLRPWPLAVPELAVRCEGRRLSERFAHEDSLRRALKRAPWETVEIRLTPP